MSAINELGFKEHCLIAAISIGTGAVAGGICLGSVMTGALCGVTRHIINLTAFSRDLYSSPTVGKIVVLFKVAMQTLVIVLGGFPLTLSPLSVVGFFVVSAGLSYLTHYLLNEANEWIVFYKMG